MLRADFEAHILWRRLKNTDQQVSEVLSLGEISDAPDLEVVRFVAGHYWSFHKQRNRLSSLFTAAMLDQVDQAWSEVEGYVNSRLSSGTVTYSQYARDSAESSLLRKAAWPALRPSPAQINGDRTLFEDLLETQRLSIEALDRAHAKLRAEIVELKNDASIKVDETATSLDELVSLGRAIRADMEVQKGRVDEVVADGVKEVSSLQTKNESAYREWRNAREAEFNENFEPLRLSIKEKLDEASEDLTQLRKVVKEYKALSSADAADTLAKNYEAEAKASRRWGGLLYAVGIILLIGGATPLVLGLGQQPTDSGAEVLNWQQITLRVAVGALAASAATVAIRLGSRLISDAGAVKRMALEFRVIDPFLANVRDRENVDTVRVDLVDRTFGRSYIPAQGDKSKDDDEVVNVGAVSQLLGAVGKMLNR
ncbi:hypothetical protein [Plantibacter sp. YIM 135249]|uniref:hypothetical protein n=1 Tax=Plantibacter sp. YIM 135249 TaxID=3423918 RepID=UPI003D340177